LNLLNLDLPRIFESYLTKKMILSCFFCVNFKLEEKGGSRKEKEKNEGVERGEEKESNSNSEVGAWKTLTHEIKSPRHAQQFEPWIHKNVEALYGDMHI